MHEALNLKAAIPFSAFRHSLPGLFVFGVIYLATAILGQCATITERFKDFLALPNSTIIEELVASVSISPDGQTNNMQSC